MCGGGKIINDWVYVVRGHKIEALLGSEAAKEMVIQHICPEGLTEEKANRSDRILGTHGLSVKIKSDNMDSDNDKRRCARSTVK